MARTIQSPGVEINEIDLTLRPVTVEGTSVFVAGFANQGPIDEVLQPTSISEFEQIYGSPTNSAERYFYHTVRNVLNSSPARVIVSRLPYGIEKGDGFETWRYSALAYPVKAVSTQYQPGSASYSVNSISVSFSGSGYDPLSGIVVLIDGIDVESSINVEFGYDGTTYGISAINVPSEIFGFTSSTRTVTISTIGYTPLSAAIVFASGNTQVIPDSYTTTSEILPLAETYFIGKPTHIELSAEEYQDIIEGNIGWSDNPTSTSFNFNNLGDSAFIVLNKAQTTVNNKFEGYYVGFADNNNFNPATQFNSILTVDAVQSNDTAITNYTKVPNARLNFALSATKFGNGNSISEVMENLTQFDLSETSFQDTVSLGLFKLRQSIFTPDTISLDYVLSESYTGSLDYHRQIADPNGGPAQTFYLGRLSESSPNFNVIVNPHLSNRFQDTWLNNNGVPSKKVRFLTKQLETPFADQGNYDTVASYVTRVGATSATVASYASTYGYADSLFPLGIYSNTVTVDKTIGNLPTKLDRVFELVENSDLYPINLALEGGLGTIYVNAIEQSGLSTGSEYVSAGSFVDSTPLNTLSAFYTTNSENLNADGLRIRGNYTAIANIFVNAAEKQRKDFLVVLDPIRNIFVQGENSKTINAKKLWSPNAGVGADPSADGYVVSNFSQHIYWPLRHQFGTINSSYATIYANWAQVIDPQTNRQIWVPFSGFAAAAMANTDSNFQPWFAPAGFTRGVVVGANDLGVYPKQKQRDQLYKISLNPVAFYPNEGFVIFGQKTLLKKPSAFDRINVRRLFLNLEVATKNTAKYFVFEPNTLFTRTQVVNALTPIFEAAKNTEGLYDYRIICSELNNTPEVIDNNELKIDIYIQPVRTAEFILVNFYATRTGTNFEEILGV